MGLTDNLLFVIIIVVLLFIVLRAAIRVIPEYERGVIFRLGRVIKAKGPGLFFIIPIVDQMIRVDLRVVTLDVPTQETITLDNVTVKVNAVCYFRVIDPIAAVINVSNYLLATQQIAQTTLRSVLGQSELDELLAQRDDINRRLQQIIDDQTEPWGVKVSVVEIKDLSHLDRCSVRWRACGGSGTGKARQNYSCRKVNCRRRVNLLKRRVSSATEVRGRYSYAICRR
ncbi:MAG: SPFH domain-containing protein [Caldilineaceae bacterium]